jgi:hypothetical protein
VLDEGHGSFADVLAAIRTFAEEFGRERNKVIVVESIDLLRIGVGTSHSVDSASDVVDLLFSSHERREPVLSHEPVVPLIQE